jgi:hypothetical protein
MNNKLVLPVIAAFVFAVPIAFVLLRGAPDNSLDKLSPDEYLRQRVAAFQESQWQSEAKRQQQATSREARRNLAGVSVVVGLYLLPCIVAAGRRHRNFAPISIVNIFLGWSFVGWVVALAWACSGNVDTKGTPQANGRTKLLWAAATVLFLASLVL